MKLSAPAAVVLMLAGGSCLWAAAAARSLPTRGEPHHLRLSGDVLAFCDARGARTLDLRAAREAAGTGTCAAPEEANAACSQIGVDVEVRSPGPAPDDALDLKGVSLPLKGRVRDCVAAGDTMAVATGSSVAVIEIATARMAVLDRTGGERVVVGPNWVAWSSGSKLRWLPRPKR
jgi:hypothetical protein